jgi:RNA polymerase sigma factor (sigma-70 family)
MNSLTRPTLLEHLRDGADPLAWDEFFGRYGRLIYCYARRRGCSDDTSEEIVQEVMLKVYQQKDIFHYDPGRGRFRDWLGALVRNQVAEYRRRPARRIRARGGASGGGLVEAADGSPPPEISWETAFEDSLLIVLLDVVRREMNPRDYLAFELLALGALSGAEVARLTGLTRNAAYKARRRALRRLSELGRSYRDNGQLGDRVRQALRSLPRAAAERSLSTRIRQTLQSREDISRHARECLSDER